MAVQKTLVGPGCTPGEAFQNSEEADVAWGGLMEGVVEEARNAAAEAVPSCGEGETQRAVSGTQLNDGEPEVGQGASEGGCHAFERTNWWSHPELAR